MSEHDYAVSLARELDALIEAEGPDSVAAFIAEPIMGTGGILTPPEGYFAEVQEVLKKHDVLMIADEVITGFGRLGEMFGCAKYGIEPDLMTIAKGLTSGYQPLSASLVTDEIYEALVQGSKEHGNFAHGYTYSGHPVAAAAGLANLDIIEREDLVGNADRVGRHFQEQLRERLKEEPLAGDVRGEGLMAGVELVAERASKKPFELSNKVHTRLARQCYHEEDLIVRPLPGGHTLGFSPPLVVSEAEVDDLLERFHRGLKKVTGDMVREGHRLST
jgi:L-2,4-diaminobutyrate transaminase